MIPLSLARIAEITRAALSGMADPRAVVRGPVVIDSRGVEPGVAVRRAARASGRRPRLRRPGDRGRRRRGAGRAGRSACPRSSCRDVLAALADAGHARSSPRSPSATVIGVTGSAGKTSTKDLLARLTAGSARPSRPPASFNNEIGHPLTVLQGRRDTRYLVLELGARGMGHIDAPGPHRAARDRRGAQRRHRAHRRVRRRGGDRQGQGRARRGAAAHGRRRAQRRRPAGPRDGRRAPAPGRDCSAGRRGRRRARRGRRRRRARARRVHAGTPGLRPGHGSSCTARTRWPTRWPPPPAATSSGLPVADHRRGAVGGRRRAAAGGWRSPTAPTGSRWSTTPTTPTPTRCGPRSTRSACSAGAAAASP